MAVELICVSNTFDMLINNFCVFINTAVCMDFKKCFNIYLSYIRHHFDFLLFFGFCNPRIGSILHTKINSNVLRLLFAGEYLFIFLWFVLV